MTAHQRLREPDAARPSSPAVVAALAAIVVTAAALRVPGLTPEFGPEIGGWTGARDFTVRDGTSADSTFEVDGLGNAKAFEVDETSTSITRHAAMASTICSAQVLPGVANQAACTTARWFCAHCVTTPTGSCANSAYKRCRCSSARGGRARFA